MCSLKLTEGPLKHPKHYHSSLHSLTLHQPEERGCVVWMVKKPAYLVFDISLLVFDLLLFPNNVLLCVWSLYKARAGGGGGGCSSERHCRGEATWIRIRGQRWWKFIGTTALSRSLPCSVTSHTVLYNKVLMISLVLCFKNLVLQFFSVGHIHKSVCVVI